MKKFSNETKMKRTGVYIKVFIKRYFRFAFIPLLICIAYCMGVLSKSFLYTDKTEVTAGEYIAGGIAVILIMLLFGFIIYTAIERMVIVVKNLIKEITITVRRLPRKVSNFIEKEKQLFKQDVEKEFKRRNW